MHAIFEAQRRAFDAHRFPEARERRRHLEALRRLVQQNQDRFALAIDADFGGRSEHETFVLDVLPSLEAIAHARRHVGRWMRPARPWLSVLFQPASAEVVPQPLGVVGIIVPWNLPLTLSMGPLVAALSAGNRAMLKMSEFTPRTAELMATLVREHFPSDHVAVIEGDAAVAAEFAALPFDHLLFTGSTGVGKLVMRAAAENLTPVTLELGGKSPAILAPDYPVDLAARRILFGKCINAGQLCIAPDYVLAPRQRVSAFVDAAREQAARLFPSPTRNADYTTIIDERHHRRLQGYLEDAVAQGARVIPLDGGAAPPRDARRIPPTLVLDATADMLLLQHEIFGPLLPILPYDTLDEAIAYVNSRPRPLALYCFTRDEHVVRRVTRETVSGGVAINDTLVHVGPSELPFGGVGPSGMGHYHGRYGFDTFSKQKAVLRQARFSTAPWIAPPYDGAFSFLKRLLLRLV